MKDLDSLRTPQLNELLESIGFNKSDIRKYAFIQAIQLIFYENTCYSKFFKELSWAKRGSALARLMLGCIILKLLVQVLINHLRPTSSLDTGA